MTVVPTRATRTDDEDGLRGLIGASVAVAAWGGSSVLAKLMDLDGLALGVYRFWFYAVLLGLWMGRKGLRIDRRVLRASAFGGIALGFDVAFFYSAVKLTTVVNATLIGALQPVIVAVVAARFFGERIHGRDAIAAMFALAGVVVVVVSAGASPEWSPLGDALAAGALLSWSAYFVLSKQSGGRLTSTEFTAGTAVWAGLVNAPLAVAFGQDLSWPSWHDWRLLVVMVVSAGIAGHSLMNWSLVRIPLWVGSTLTLLIPVVASVLAWVVLDEPISAVQGAAMALVIVSLAAIVHNQAGARTR